MVSYGELDFRLTIVPRWVIVPTVQKQSVAGHCFLVERIATHIAKEIFKIKDEFSLYTISQWALHHDDEEAIIGDIPSPGKQYVAIAGSICPQPPDYAFYEHIVKIADLMETYFFIMRDIKLGNGYVTKHAERIAAQLKKYIHEHVSDSGVIKNLEKLIWDQEEEVSDVYPSIGSAEESAERSTG